MTDNHLNYARAGVNIDAGEALVKQIGPLARSTHRPGVLTGLGGFGALFELPLKDYREPVLVSGTDGVGTKLKLAIAMQRHDTIGIDLVAMCANDLVVAGAEPMFFLDYYACGKLSVTDGTEVMKGIAEGCRQAGCALIGGETAEMPGMYHNNDYDLAGFCVGLVEKSHIITGTAIQPGNVLIALEASGVHANGFSLVRKILEHHGLQPGDKFPGRSAETIGEALLVPTRIYVQSILEILKHFTVNGICHITGGGITENLPRIMPAHTEAVIEETREWPELFRWLNELGDIGYTEMRRTFNCGTGMIIAVNADDSTAILGQLEKLGEQAWEIGCIRSTDQTEPQVRYA